MKKWISKFYGYAPLLYAADYKSPKILDLAYGQVVTSIDELNGFDHVEYVNDKGQAIYGWLLSDYIEPYLQNLPHDLVNFSGLQTANPNDAKQYFDWQGYKQVNFCGEICLAYLLEIPLLRILEDWKGKALPFYKRIFGGGRATGTGVQDLVDLARVLGAEAKIITLKEWTPYKLQKLLESNQMIVGCRIKPDGRLSGSGIGHWISPVDITPERTGGIVEVYNPFMDRYEQYSWQEFIASAPKPYGIIINIPA